MKTIIANRDDFFRENCCPVALRTIHNDTGKQHKGDLTDLQHTHDFAELIIITRGGGIHWIDGDEYEVAAGDVFLIQGNTSHYFTERYNLEMYNIMFDDSFLRDHLKSLYSLPGFNAFFLFEPTCRKRHRFQSRLHLNANALLSMHTLLRQMEQDCQSPAPGTDLLLLAKTLEIFVIISKEYSQDSNPMVRSLFRLGEVVTRLKNEYMQPWTLKRIAKIAAMAPSTLIPIFKEVTGESPIEYLLKVRLKKAAESLSQSDKSISEIAHECGFADSNYFSRQFKKLFGISPRDYRQQGN